MVAGGCCFQKRKANADLAPCAASLCSIRFALLSEEEQLQLQGSLAGPKGGAPLHSVQLRSRHWLIRDASGAVDSEVRGEAVVGHYPLLRAGAPLGLGRQQQRPWDPRPAARSGLPSRQLCWLRMRPAHRRRALHRPCPAGAPAFAYQSCTHQKEAAGSMEGSFRFVEGSLQQPGREFDVACAQFNLSVPEVMF